MKESNFYWISLHIGGYEGSSRKVARPVSRLHLFQKSYYRISMHWPTTYVTWQGASLFKKVLFEREMFTHDISKAFYQRSLGFIGGTPGMHFYSTCHLGKKFWTIVFNNSLTIFNSDPLGSNLRRYLVKAKYIVYPNNSQTLWTFLWPCAKRVKVAYQLLNFIPFVGSGGDFVFLTRYKSMNGVRERY